MKLSNEFYDYLDELPEKWEQLPDEDIRIIKMHALAGVEVGKKISYERKIKPINIFKDGVLVMTANRIAEAEACVNSKRDSIYKVLRGERRSVKGYTFEYAERGGCN
ncbi:hypothetical protein C8U37_107139 [Trichococcus patagoniensis]|uniref:Uncharacterized protein n=1 Tax=Trichococcus patagoniensis TaxID=382641 RepID=A0A2T5ILT2_9LACT|nr:hypothetical protein [Trichococcus patagoniensis]PTQ84771.1 hypothetical protein C8U37_107139 [Trichococcus patagoniensis]